MYERAPDEKELAAFGMTLEDVAAEPVDIWPEHVQAFELFNFMGTQWRTGMSGPTGLDYGVMHRKMDRMKLSEEEYDQLEADVMVMERTALACIHEKK